MSIRERSRALVAVGAVALIAAGAGIGVWIGRGTTGSPQATVWGEPRAAIEFEAKPGQSAEFVASMQRLRNELPYKPSWDDQDVRFVVDEMDLDVSDVTRRVEAAAPARLDEDLARNMTEREIRKTFSILVTAEVLGADQPMTEENRRRLEAMLTALLEHPDPFYRRLGVDAMFDSGLIRRDTIHHLVNEVAAGDEDRYTRERAQYLLNEYDLSVLGAAGDRTDDGS